MEYKIVLRRPYHDGDTFALCSVEHGNPHLPLEYCTVRLSSGNNNPAAETVYLADNFCTYHDALANYEKPKARELGDLRNYWTLT